MNPTAPFPPLPPEAPTVVLLHASAGSARQWSVAAARLAPHARVVAPDLHGHGAAPPWPADRPYSLADEAARLDAVVGPLLDDLHGRSAPLLLVGHSFGGAVAAEAVRRHPGAFAAVVLYEPVLFGLLRADGFGAPERRQAADCAAAVRVHLARGDATGAAGHFVAFWSGEAAWAAMPPDRRAGVAARMATVARHFDAAFTAADPRPALARVPLVVMRGGATVPVARRIARLLEHTLPGARHLRLPGLGHLGPLTHADAFATSLVECLFHRRASATRPALHPSPTLPVIPSAVPERTLA